VAGRAAIWLDDAGFAVCLADYAFIAEYSVVDAGDHVEDLFGVAFDAYFAS
jgi:hypothetical protein